jgi:hypothetical protein
MKNKALELWLEDKNAAINQFFEELKTVDAPAYLEIPLSFKEWQKEKDPFVKTATVVLFTLWLNDVDLKTAWKSWFYKEGKYLIMVEADKNNSTVAIINRETGKIFVETYLTPKEFEPFFLVDSEGVLNED